MDMLVGSTLKLFKALPIKEKLKGNASKNLLSETTSRGFLFAPEVVYNYKESDLLDIIKNMGITPEQLNSSFHKSWKKIKETDTHRLVLEQMIHYITTYGFERLGIYGEDTVYIPKEKLEIPDIDTDSIKLVVIRGYTREEIRDKLISLLQSGIALKSETADCAVEIGIWLDLTEKEIESIKNKEVKNIFYSMIGKVPRNPTEFLRYVIYEITGSTLLIKSKDVITAISSSKSPSIIKHLRKYESEYGLDRLSEIFYRFKPIFLAMRVSSPLKQMVNKIRRLAVKNHKPMKEDFLNEVTSKLKRGVPINFDVLDRELSRVNVFRRIRLAYSLKYRTTDQESILYRIRNGKGYATEFNFSNHKGAQEVLDIVIKSIADGIKDKVYGKTIYIPTDISYALPSTEKQFVGYIPSGSYIKTNENMIFGVHWHNVGSTRIDLDLSVINFEGKIGWDGSYRNEEATMMFSGDMTNASGKDGASEFFHVSKQVPDRYIIFLNYFNLHSTSGKNVPFQLIIGKEKVSEFGRNYMIDPNNVMATMESSIIVHQKVIGLLEVDYSGSKFYLAEAIMGTRRTAANEGYVTHSRKFLFKFYHDAITLDTVLRSAGANIVNSAEDMEKVDIDLSPQNLEKGTILDMFV